MKRMLPAQRSELTLANRRHSSLQGRMGSSQSLPSLHTCRPDRLKWGCSSASVTRVECKRIDREGLATCDRVVPLGRKKMLSVSAHQWPHG